MMSSAARPIKVVIFDCDGVLVESRAANAAFYNQILAHFNKEPLTDTQLTYVHARTVYESLAYLFQGDSRLPEVERFWRTMDYGPINSLLTLQPGLIECLAELHGRFKTAIATNRTTTMAGLLRRFGIEGHFDLVVTSLDVREPKPHPEAVRKILSFFGVTNRQACYVGDSTVDEETAWRAEVRFIAYRNESLQADHHVSHLSELIPLLDRLSPAHGAAPAPLEIS
jgi:phosphoglycolate phosphatase-like HAD superfamily hydrolase